MMVIDALLVLSLTSFIVGTIGFGVAWYRLHREYKEVRAFLGLLKKSHKNK